MSEKPRILILTLSFGAGHISAAQAVAAEFEKQIPTADVRTIDTLKNCSLCFRAFYVWTYWAMIRRAPRLWNKFFAARVERRDEQTAPVWMWRRGCRKVFEEINTFQPQIIVAAEVGACEIAVIARREKLTNAEIVNVITDFEAEPIWVKPEISAFAVASEKVKKQLENWGANAEKIAVCGIPLNASFSEIHDVNKTKSHFDLDSRPIVLLMGGGMGPTRMDEVAARLLEKGADLQIVALPAKDAKAKAALNKLQNSPTVSLRVINWMNSIAGLMQAADILATKPGGLTLSEAAACGVPLVLFDSIPGPEVQNAQWFVGQGAGIQTNGSDETASEILRLLKNQSERARMSENVKMLAQIGASEKIVGLVTDALERSPILKNNSPPSKRFSAYRKMFLASRQAEARKAKLIWKQAEIKSGESEKNFKITGLRTEIK